jgi:hypothetical protein
MCGYLREIINGRYDDVDGEGKERKGKERKGKERKGKERKGKRGICLRS